MLRERKKRSKIMAAHTGRHLELLHGRWRETAFKEGQARQIAERIEMVLNQLPGAIWQAHERIIGERQGKNGEKIFSLATSYCWARARARAA